MRLEGTLDAFSLPDIFQLLSYTKKTGALHLRRADQHGVVHLRDGAVTGGRSDASCQALGRRIVGAGLADDDILADAVEKVLDDSTLGLGKALADSGRLHVEDLKRLAGEQATDAVFELLRWPDGEFAFVVDEPDPDDMGASLLVEDVVAEGRRRLETWSALAEKVPSPDAVVRLAPAPGEEMLVRREEWGLLSLVDGHRSVAQLVTLSGTGEYLVVSALAELADRGLIVIAEPSEDAGGVSQRQQLLAALEGHAEPVAEAPAAAVVAEAPAAPAAPAPRSRQPEADRKPVIPERPEPFTPERRPEYAEELPALARMAASAKSAASAPSPAAGAPAASVGSVQGAHALAPDAVPAASSHIDRDPSVNKSLLLRLIAGVRGL